MLAESSYRLPFVFSILAALYFLSQFFRTSNAIIAPNLIRDLRLSAETLGILGAGFFYAFAFSQIPMGPMLDRIGPRLVLSYSMLLAASGSFLFGIGDSFTTALVGRILIGLGMASVLMGAMKVFILYCPPERFATLSGIMLSIGMMGNILSTSPLAYLSSTIGWRMTFLIGGGVTALLALLSLQVLKGRKRDVEGDDPKVSAGKEIGVFQSMGLVVRSLAFWQLGLLTFFRYGTFVALQGLWLGPYLIDIQGYTPVQAGNLLIMTAVGTIIGGPVSGRLSDQVFRKRKAVTLWGTVLYTLTLLSLTGFLKIQHPWCFGVIFFFAGFFGSFGMLIFSHRKVEKGTVLFITSF